MRIPTVDRRRADLYQQVDALDEYLAQTESLLNGMPWNCPDYEWQSNLLHELQLQRAKLIVKIDRNSARR